MANISFKLDSRTLIFMLNPCHAAIFFLVFLTMTDYSCVGEIVALAFYGFSFGGWIGLLFSENEGLPWIEVLVYYVHHAIVSGLGPILLSAGGRYDIRRFFSLRLIWAGAILFTLYERWVLMPISLLSWANLNHSLCGVHNDPFYEIFQLGKWYWLWADLYLAIACFLGFFINTLLVVVFARLSRLVGI